MEKKNHNIVFFGTPEFAVESLKILHENNYNIKAVVTAPDKPAGRGKKLKTSQVKDYALSNNLYILQPENLKNEGFINTLKGLNPDIFVVVAFRMLPKLVFEIPKLGCFNLHASLLPDYRGAAPINHAIINDEKITGVSSFFINEKIDTGDIILRESVKISDDINAGKLHDILKVKGAEVVEKTVELILNNDYSLIKQNSLITHSEKKAPKITKDFCKIDWSKKGREIFNFVRGLSPYPGAFFKVLDKNNKVKSIKLFDVGYEDDANTKEIKTILTDGKSYFYICCDSGYIKINVLQPEGKKRMNIKDFLKGNNPEDFVVL